MKNKLYTYQNPGMCLEDGFWDVFDLTTLSEFNEVDKQYKILFMFFIDNSLEAKSLIFSQAIKKLNLPSIFVISETCNSLIEDFFNEGFINIFSLEENEWLLKSHIKNIFKNYHQYKGASIEKIFCGFDHSILTKTERQIIEVLCQSPYFSQTKKDLYKLVWGSTNLNTNTLDVHLCNLKRKLKNFNVQINSQFNGIVKLDF